PATSLAWMDHVMDKLDVVLLMSVNPGFGGQAFIPETINKIAAVRAKADAWKQATGKTILVEVDGGVKADNIGTIAAAGADTFVAGSAIFGAKNRAGYEQVIRRMRSELASACDAAARLRAEEDRRLYGGA
ncbi:MAG: hypothetical protein RR784_10260, partial [Burkholderiaceae bacterium]